MQRVPDSDDIPLCYASDYLFYVNSAGKAKYAGKFFTTPGVLVLKSQLLLGIWFLLKEILPGSHAEPVQLPKTKKIPTSTLSANSFLVFRM